MHFVASVGLTQRDFFPSNLFGGILGFGCLHCFYCLLHSIALDCLLGCSQGRKCPLERLFSKGKCNHVPDTGILRHFELVSHTNSQFSIEALR